MLATTKARYRSGDPSCVERQTGKRPGTTASIGPATDRPRVSGPELARGGPQPHRGNGRGDIRTAGNGNINGNFDLDAFEP